MGLCFSRKETQTTQLDSSFSLDETQLDSCISQCQVEELEPEYIGIGWFDMPYNMMCSEDKEVGLSRNYAERIQIMARGEGRDRKYRTFIYAKNEILHFYIQKSASGECQVHWYMDDEKISMDTFGNQDLIEFLLFYFNYFLDKNTKSLASVEILINDFPYDRTNIKNLRSRTLKSLILRKNKHGIDPISCGFVDFDIISRFQNRVKIPNCQLSDLFKMKSEIRYLTNLIFSLEEFDDYLRRLLIEEEIDENIKEIRLDLKRINCRMRSNELKQVIKKYIGPMGCFRQSKKWESRYHCIILLEHSVEYSMQNK